MSNYFNLFEKLKFAAIGLIIHGSGPKCDLYPRWHDRLVYEWKPRWPITMKLKIHENSITHL